MQAILSSSKPCGWSVRFPNSRIFFRGGKVHDLARVTKNLHILKPFFRPHDAPSSIPRDLNAPWEGPRSGSCCTSTSVLSGIPEKNGKIGLASLGIIYSVLLKTLQYLLSQVSQTRWPFIHDVLVCRHQNLPYQIISIIFTSPYMAFKYDF